MNEPLPVICLAGPTGAGKTALAIELACAFDAEIVNADSRQVYASFPVITAQPAREEQAACPHHLYGYLSTGKKLGAGQWARLAFDICGEIIARGHIPLLVGGTGFYFSALMNGLASIPEIDPAIGESLSRRLEAMGLKSLYAELASVDAPYAAKIHPHDRQRVLRALEVFEGTGKTFSWWHRHSRAKPMCAGPYFLLEAPLRELEPRLAMRIDQMIAQGAEEEAARAWGECPHEEAPGWSGIGCAEVLGLLQGKYSRAECRSIWLANTRAYAKRQLTWFRGRKNALPVEDKNTLFELTQKFLRCQA